MFQWSTKKAWARPCQKKSRMYILVFRSGSSLGTFKFLIFFFSCHSLQLPGMYDGYPAEHFTILELRNSLIDELYVAEKRRSTIFEALNGRNVRSG